jgi:hypothetical protein
MFDPPQIIKTEVFAKLPERLKVKPSQRIWRRPAFASNDNAPTSRLLPAKAGIQEFREACPFSWFPAFAG